MDDKIKLEKPVKEEIKSTEFKVLEIEDASAILDVLEWRIRVNFDESLTKEQKEKIRVGMFLTVKYIGDLKDVHSLRIQRLTEV